VLCGVAFVEDLYRDVNAFKIKEQSFMFIFDNAYLDRKILPVCVNCDKWQLVVLLDVVIKH